jgi:hypothetical protein
MDVSMISRHFPGARAPVQRHPPYRQFKHHMCEPHADHAADDLSGRLMAAVSFGGLVAVAVLNMHRADPAVIRNSVQLGREAGSQQAEGHSWACPCATRPTK